MKKDIFLLQLMGQVKINVSYLILLGLGVGGAAAAKGGQGAPLHVFDALV